MDHGNGAITHGVHLAQAAGLGLGGHQVDVAAGVDPGSQTQIEHDLGGALLGIFRGQILEEGLVLGLAGTQDQQLAVLLPQQAAGDVAQQIQTLVAGQAGYHDHQGYIGLDRQAHFLLQGSLTFSLADIEGIRIEVRGQGGVGLGIEGTHVNTVGDAGELPGGARQDAVQAVGVVGVHQLPGIGLGNGGDQIGTLNGALHHVDAAAHIQGAPVLPGQTQHIIEEGAVCPALILDVVDGIHTAGLRKVIPVDTLQIHGDQGRLPIIALDHIGDVVQNGHGIQTGPGEVGVTLAVIHVAVDGAGTAAEVILIIDKVDLNAVGAVCQLHQTGILLTPAQSHPVLGNQFHRVLFTGLDLVVVGQEQRDLIALDALKCGRQRLHYVAQTAGLGVGRTLGCTDRDSHTTSPRLTMMGFLAVP